MGISSDEPAAALARWRSFPADADPRPLVMVAGFTRGPHSGFADGADKMAYLAGAFDLAVTPPAGPATLDGYSVVPAREAFDRLCAEGVHDIVPSTRLRIVSAALGQSEFGTDRGLRRLPGWRFGIDRVRDPVWVLAVGSQALWPYPPRLARTPDFGAKLGPDGRTLSYQFIGAPDEPPPRGMQYAATATESATAVVIEVQEVRQRRVQEMQPQRKDGAAVVVNRPGYRRTVTLQLAAPLGGRVLLTADGAPIVVTGQ